MEALVDQLDSDDSTSAQASTPSTEPDPALQDGEDKVPEESLPSTSSVSPVIEAEGAANGVKNKSPDILEAEGATSLAGAENRNPEKAEEQGLTPSPVPNPAPIPLVRPFSRQNWTFDLTFAQRQLNIIRFGFLSDFSIFLGPDTVAREEKQLVLVHKVMIAASSIVFYNKVLTAVSEGLTFLELDEDPKMFTYYLQYLYTGESGVRFKEAFLLQKFAVKYQMNDLQNQCDKVIATEEFNMDSAYMLLPVAVHSKHVSLTKNLMDFACKNGTAFIKDDRFLSLSEEVVIQLLKRDDLRIIQEMDVLSSVIHWGKNQCKQRRLDENDPGNLAKYLQNVIRHVRFPCDFTPKFWLTTWHSGETRSTGVLMNELFHPKHIFANYNRTCRQYAYPSCLVHYRYPESNKKLPVAPWRCKNPKFRLRENLRFLLNFPFTIYGFALVPGMFGEDFEANVYDYDELLVTTTITSHSTFQPTLELSKVVQRNSEPPQIQVNFQRPVELVVDTWVTMSVTFSGFIKYKAKSDSGDFQKISVNSCQMHVGTGMTEEYNTTFVPVDVKMIFPILCEFSRPPEDSPENSLPLDKGYIECIFFSMNKPHPQGQFSELRLKEADKDKSVEDFPFLLRND